MSIEKKAEKFIKIKEQSIKGNTEKITFADFASKEDINVHTLKYHVRKQIKKMNSIRLKMDKSENIKGPDSSGLNTTKQKHDYESMRNQFMTCKFPTLASMARFYVINPDSGHYKKMTKDWLKQRSDEEQEFTSMALSSLHGFSPKLKAAEISACLHFIDRRIIQTISGILDPNTAYTIVKTLKQAKEAILNGTSVGLDLMQTDAREKLIRKYKNSKIDEKELATEMDILRLPQTQAQMEALRSFYRNDTENEFGDFDPEEIERQDAEEEKLTREKLERIRQGAEIFKMERTKEIKELKKELTPKKNP